MASVNKVMLIGRLGKDPELRNTQGGSSVCNMTLATDESYTDRDGNQRQANELDRFYDWDDRFFAPAGAPFEEITDDDDFPFI